MKKFILGLLTMTISTLSIAGDADNIAACVKKAKEFSGVILNEFDANYEGNWLSMNIAKWSNAYCEVKIGEVYKLVVNEELLIFDGFAGKGSYELNQALQEKTNSAINILNSRIALLLQRMKEVTEELKKPGSNHDKLTSYIDEGVEKSIGSTKQIDNKQ